MKYVQQYTLTPHVRRPSGGGVQMLDLQGSCYPHTIEVANELITISWSVGVIVGRPRRSLL